MRADDPVQGRAPRALTGGRERVSPNRRCGSALGRRREVLRPEAAGGPSRTDSVPGLQKVN